MVARKVKKSSKVASGQMSFFSDTASIEAGAEKKPEEPSEMMRMVVEAIPVKEKLKRTFSDAEAKQILDENAEKEEHVAFKKELKRIKHLVLDMEAKNRDRVIFYKSSEDGKFYKALDTSALYYAYRLADRMGRKCNIMIDTDRFCKAQFVASVAGIDKFVQQYKELEGLEPEITIDGVYIFPLKEPITDEDLRMLRQTEKTRLEKMHGLLKPKKMAPAVYQQILMLIRRLAPRSVKLKNDTVSYKIFGDEMLKNMKNILAIYAKYTNGLTDEDEAVKLILSETGEIKAALIILGETRKWGAVPLAMIGEDVNILEQLVEKDLKKGKKK